MRVIGMLILILTLAGCIGGAESASQRSSGVPPVQGCGPVPFEEVRGPAPDWVSGPLSGFDNDRAMCRGQWLTDGGKLFVPQGLAVRGNTAWVGGYDARGYKPCRILKVDLRTGRTLAQRGGGGMRVAGGPSHACRHGGGVAMTDQGLFVTQRDGLWLLDPDSLEVVRGWWLDQPVRGSYLAFDPAGNRLGLGNYTYRPGRRGTFHWFSVDRLMKLSGERIDANEATSTRRTPPAVQGAVWGSLDGRRPALWFAASSTRCGVLHGPRGAHHAAMPGAEGLAMDTRSRRLWVVSESSSRPWFSRGGRPVVPHLAQFTADVHRWDKASCSP